MELKSIIPILRIFEEQKAKEFYINFLEFNIDWEHRFDNDLPLYMQISKEDTVIHLSEHNGDGTPGTVIIIKKPDLLEYHTYLNSKNYKYSRPDIVKRPWGIREMPIIDPFGNKLIFAMEIEKK